jgi:translation initiation factor 2B subunit (eIF-2B alpha/beta/delta family)
VDARLKREINTISLDNLHGATELTQRAARAVLNWMARHPRPNKKQWEVVVRAVFHCQRAMAPMLRLANEIASGLESESPTSSVSQRLRDYSRRLRTAAPVIAHLFKKHLQQDAPCEVITFSYSSTVLNCLFAARNRIAGVTCSESRPMMEGRLMASKLARAGIRVDFMSDAALGSQFGRNRKQLLILGADAILFGYVAAKIGSKALFSRARECNVEIILAADTAKCWPMDGRSAHSWEWRSGPSQELWKRPPQGVTVHNPYFELTPTSSRMKFLTELGWMNRGAVYRAIRGIRVSPLLRQIVD